MQTIITKSGIIGLPARRLQHGSADSARRVRLISVAASGKGKAAPLPPPPAEAPTPLPQDIPAYFQPAPEPQVYQAVPQYGPPRPVPPAQTGIPPYVWIGVGVVLASVVGKVMAVIKGGPQKVQEVAIEQMMKQMMKQMGAQGGASPFGTPGTNPFGAEGANPFGAAAANPFGAAAHTNPFGVPAASSGFPGSGFGSPAFDTTATPAAAAPSTGPSSTLTASDNAAGGAPTTSSTTGTNAKPKKRSAFVDVDASSSSGGSAGAGAGVPPPPPPFSMPPPTFNMPPGMAGMAGTAGGAVGTGSTGGFTSAMLEMLKNPELQKALYPYLPEPFRNPESIEWMLNTPEQRNHLETMLQQQAAATGSPAVLEMMQGMDMSPEKMKASLSQLGMTPSQFLEKVMSDPDLASSMANPKVMAAIAECSKNPMALFQYQNDEQVMLVFEKMGELFPGAPGSMASGFGVPPTQPPSQL